MIQMAWTKGSGRAAGYSSFADSILDADDGGQAERGAAGNFLR